ncbi:Teichoic acids export ATP-binding protein TagH [Rubinisphaera italica]|uniref:Teichoic acids export ATP-binding protein TagH n=2 Tax=Rubinisphaera italica TaxID=2527969 RepID=A0A5C5XE85_9PLAN|nr:Teichoic acids export ATP-binding protein TagH [Rubinisphaera italica]
MSNVALRVEGLGKKYRIGTHQPYNRLSEAITGLGKSIISLPQKMINKSKPIPQNAASSENEFWALRDINFEVKEGDVVGIIGRNGAGKSTLLKILSRITEPTEGRFGVRGRISSLLEVGTGFHPELTGRENIYLSGSVLGMTRSEIKSHFDEIVDFSGVEKFLDTPVKRYSSGMQVRLGFAVAAHLKSEILIIDEVLAVGDIEFQRKCMGKMSDVAHGGRTILFVSHNMAAISRLCNKAILIEEGDMVLSDTTENAIKCYLNVNEEASSNELIWDKGGNYPGNDDVQITKFGISNTGMSSNQISIDFPVQFSINYRLNHSGMRLSSGIVLSNMNGEIVLTSANRHSASIAEDKYFNIPLETGDYKATCNIPANLLNANQYYAIARIYQDISNVIAETPPISFKVTDSGSMRKEFLGEWAGIIRPRLDWKTRVVC